LKVIILKIRKNNGYKSINTKSSSRIFPLAL